MSAGTGRGAAWKFRASNEDTIDARPRRASDVAPAMSLFAGRFEVGRLLGRGGFGAVHQAFDRELGADVALKILTDPRAGSRARFTSEFRLLLDTHHPNLVQLSSLSQHEGEWGLGMELVDGVGVLAHLGHDAVHEAPTGAHDDAPRTTRAVEPDRVVTVLRGLAEGLCALHRAGLLHRDVKPSNVLIERGTERPVLLDFGLVLSLDEAAQRARVIAGTPHYMAPEQVRGDALAPASDWYALGALAFELLTGRRPFAGPTLAVLEAKITRSAPAVSMLVPGTPRRLESLVASLLAPRAEDRPSGDAVLDALRALSRSQPRSGVRPCAATRPAPIAVLPAAPPLVGRDRELALLDDAAIRALRSEDVVRVHVRGVSGIGKTALVQRWALGLARAGTRVLRGRAYRSERVSFQGLDDLAVDLALHTSLDALAPEAREVLARVFPRTLGADVDRASLRLAGSAAVDRGDLVRALRALIAGAEAPRVEPEHRLTVLWLDDVQWLDRDSLDVLSALVATSLPRTLLVTTGRPDRCASDAWAASGAGVLGIELGALDVSAAAALVRARHGEVEPGVVSALHGASGGNPFLLLRALEQEAAPSLALRAHERRLLEVLAIAGGPLARRVALDAAGVPREQRVRMTRLEIDRWTRSAGDDGALDLAHDRIRDELLAGLSQPARIESHLALAERLAAEPGADRAAIGVHLMHAGERARALPELSRAADEARASFAFARAAELYAHALGCAPAPALARALTIARGEALCESGRAAEGAELFVRLASELEEACDTEARALRHDVLRRAGEALLLSGDPRRGRALLQRLFRELGLAWPGAPAPTLARLVLSRARYALGLPPRAAPLDAVRREVLWSTCRALTHADPLRSAAMQTELYLRTEGRSDPATRARVLLTEVVLESIRGTLSTTRTRALLLEIDALVSLRDDPRLAATATLGHAFAAVYRGDFAGARRLLRTCMDAHDRLGLGRTWERSWIVPLLLFVEFQCGELDAVRALATEAALVHSASGDRLGLAQVLLRHTPFGWLALDRPDEADAWLARGLDAGPAREPGLLAHFASLARMHVALYRDDTSEARRIARADARSSLASGAPMSQFVRIDALAAHARAELAALSPHERGARLALVGIARLLELEQSAWAAALADIVRGSLDALDDPLRGASRLDAASRDLEARGVVLFALAARWQAARLRRRPDEMDAAIAHAHARGVALPARLFATLVPLPPQALEGGPR